MSVRRRVRLVGLMLVFLVFLGCSPGARAPEVQWEPLFNGRDLQDWVHVGPGRFVVEDGIMRTEGGMGLLYYAPRQLGRAVLRVVYRTGAQNGNSGVFIRIPEVPTEPLMPVHRAYEVQIEDSAPEGLSTGRLYSFTLALARPGRIGEWNTIEIVLDGPRTVVSVNGVLTTDYREGQPTLPAQPGDPTRGPRPDVGFIGLQNHSDTDVVYFREVSLRPL